MVERDKKRTVIVDDDRDALRTSGAWSGILIAILIIILLALLFWALNIFGRGGSSPTNTPTKSTNVQIPSSSVNINP